MSLPACSPIVLSSPSPGHHHRGGDYFSMSGPISSHASSSGDDYFMTKVRNNSYNESTNSLNSSNSESTVNDLSLVNKSNHDSILTDHSFTSSQKPISSGSSNLNNKLNLKLNLSSLSIDETQQENHKLRSNSLNYVSNHPGLPKQLSNPILRSYSDVKPIGSPGIPQMDTKAFYDLSSQIRMLSIDELSQLISSTTIIPQLNLPNLLIIDIRPFSDFVKTHLKSSLNVCLPSTLLKRQNFSLLRCINSLPVYEKLILKSYFNYNQINQNNNHEITPVNNSIPQNKYGFPSIIVIDNYVNSNNSYFMTKKIVDLFKQFNFNIYLLNQNFQDSSSLIDPNHLESGNKPMFSINDLMNNDNNMFPEISINISPKKLNNNNMILPPKIRSNSYSENSFKGKDSAPSTPCDEFVDSSTPILSNFKLPPMNKSFTIRHNEEVLDNLNDLGILLAKKYSAQLHRLPDWLRLAIEDQKRLISQFNDLEKIERTRLNEALDIKNNYGLLSAGIEYGHKNRYKDIFLYEHSRVKLQDLDKPQLCDYINASYINSVDGINNIKNTGTFKYIASQGPMKNTVGDFWKCIVNNNIPMIVSLTNEFENGISKCEPYWIPGFYQSNNNIINLQLKNQTKLTNNLIVRQLDLIIDGGTTKSVLQFQLLNWYDNDIYSNLNELVLIIKLKQLLVQKLNIQNESSLVHCSAGCGRTGTFITLDTIINLLDFNNTEINQELIPEIIKKLREQRMSMVQNLRQFLSIYELLINYFTHDMNFNMDYDIINNFKG